MAATANHYRTIQTMDFLLARGERLESAHQFDRGLRDFQEALILAPRQEQPHEALGTFYLTQKKYDQAIQEFQEAVRLTEGVEEEPRLGLGVAYQLKGDPRKAQQIFEAVLANNARSAKDRELLAENYALLALLYDKQKLYGDAIKSYQQALLLAPNFAEAHNNLAWLYATCDDQKFRDPKAALDHAQIAVKLTRWNEGNSIDTLAEAYFVHGGYQQAVEVQKKALALAPNIKDLQEHMARYRKAAGM